MKFYCFLIFAIGILLMFSCKQDPENPESELTAALDLAVVQNQMTANVILVWKNDVLCKQIDCQQQSIFGKNQEYRLADKALHFMYGSPDYLVVKEWVHRPEVQVVKSGKQ